MKYFIITIDTEGDNLWGYKRGDSITTVNSRYIPRFQILCEKYCYKPVYLVNYEMASDMYFRNFAISTLRNKNCELGIHLHAWNSPPIHKLSETVNSYDVSYLIEYPFPIMRQKFDFLLNFLSDKFEHKPVSHRAGRWAMNQDYFDILIDYGIQIDCSITPHISWKSSRGYSHGGSDYRNCGEEPFLVKHSSCEKFITEIPVTIRKIRSLSTDASHGAILKKCIVSARNALFGKTVWLRPNGNNLGEMLALIDLIQKSDSGYIMFMLHSSELMPGGSPTFKTHESIEKLYNDIEIIFKIISTSFTGATLEDYYITGGTR